MKFNKAYEIPIPHLGFKVIYAINPKEFTGSQEELIMFCENTSKNSAAIIFRKEPTTLQSSIVAHEIMHALQFMCQRRGIVMEKEIEHMGYLMQYIFNEIYGRQYSR